MGYFVLHYFTENRLITNGELVLCMKMESKIHCGPVYAVGINGYQFFVRLSDIEQPVIFNDEQSALHAIQHLGKSLIVGDGCFEIQPFEGIKAVSKLSADELFDLGKKVLESNEKAYAPGQAAVFFFEAAKAGHSGAQTALGRMHFEGTGVAQDFEKAGDWYLKAARQGHPLAQGFLGFMYLDGTGLVKDVVKGVYWLTKAAEKGHDEARNWLREQGL